MGRAASKAVVKKVTAASKKKDVKSTAKPAVTAKAKKKAAGASKVAAAVEKEKVTSKRDLEASKTDSVASAAAKDNGDGTPTPSDTHPNLGKNAVVRKGEEYLGRWTREEHERFLAGLKEHGRAWKAVASSVSTRTVMQVRTHAQKYFSLQAQKLEMSNFAVDTPLTRVQSEHAKAEKELARAAAVKSGESVGPPKSPTKSKKQKKKETTPANTAAPLGALPGLPSPLHGLHPHAAAAAAASLMQQQQQHNNGNAAQLLAFNQQQQQMLEHQRLASVVAARQQQTAAAFQSAAASPGAPSSVQFQDSDVVVVPDAPLMMPNGNTGIMKRPANQEFKAILLANVVLYHALPSTLQWAWTQRLFQFLKHRRGLNLVILNGGTPLQDEQGSWYITQQLRHDSAKSHVLENMGSKIVGASFSGETAGAATTVNTDSHSVIALVQGSWQTLSHTNQIDELCRQGGAQWMVRLPPGVSADEKYSAPAASSVKKSQKAKAAPKKRSATDKKSGGTSESAEAAKVSSPKKKSAKSPGVKKDDDQEAAEKSAKAAKDSSNKKAKKNASTETTKKRKSATAAATTSPSKKKKKTISAAKKTTAAVKKEVKKEDSETETEDESKPVKAASKASKKPAASKKGNSKKSEPLTTPKKATRRGSTSTRRGSTGSAASTRASTSTQRRSKYQRM